MIKEKINDLIKETIKSGDKTGLEVYRSIKTAFTVYESKGKDFLVTSEKEIEILSSLVKQRMKSVNEYLIADRADLAEKEKEEIEIINQFLPKEASENEILDYIENLKTEGLELTKKNMSEYIKKLKDNFQGTSGKTFSNILQGILK